MVVADAAVQEGAAVARDQRPQHAYCRWPDPFDGELQNPIEVVLGDREVTRLFAAKRIGQDLGRQMGSGPGQQDCASTNEAWGRLLTMQAKGAEE